MAPPPALSTRDRIELLLIFLFGLLLFGSLRTPDFNDYDGVNFAFAIRGTDTQRLYQGIDQVVTARDGYDLRLHQPHPPGFPLYILCAKALWLFTRDALSALTLLSAIGGAACLALISWLARLWWPQHRAVAWLAPAWLLITPHFWLTSEKELSDVPTLALHLASIACAWRGLWSARWRVAATTLVAIGLGFRLQNAAAFLPPWLFLIALSTKTDSPSSPVGKGVGGLGIFHRCAFHVSTLCTLCSLWFAGMVLATGGWSAYREATTSYTAFLSQNPNTLGLAAGWNPAWWATRVALHANTFLLAAFGIILSQHTSSTLLILWLPGLAAAALILFALWKARSPHAITAVLWTLPYFVTQVLLFQPSNERYALPLIPSLILFASAGLAHLPWRHEFKLLLAAPLAIWLVFITTSLVRILRTQPSPLVTSVEWIYEGDHPDPTWGSGVILVEGEVHRAAEYYHPVSHIAGRVDFAFVAPPNTPLPDGHIIAQRRFTRDLRVHTKHADLVATLLDRNLR